MIKKSLMIFLVFLVALSVVSAIQTEIIVKTTPGTMVTIRLMKIDSLNTLDGGMFQTEAGNSGMISVNYSGLEPYVRLSTFIKGDTDGLKVFKTNSLGEYIKTGGKITIDLRTATPVAVVDVPTVVEPVVVEPVVVVQTNITEPVAPIVTTEVAVNKTEPIADSSSISGTSSGLSSLTGMAIFNFEGTSSKIFYSVAGIIVFGVFLTLLLMRKSHHHHASLEEPRVVKLSEVSKQSGQSRIELAEQKLQQASQELKEAQEEIIKLRSNKNELSEAQLAFQKAKENLDRVKQQVGDAGA
ncbi:MAG: hypothetical protein WCP89_01290 [archaeon]